MDDFRHVKQVIEPQMVIEGAGVRLRRSIAPHTSNLYDPFLLFDHFAFNDPLEGPILGFPMHPHRGIETVTYMLAGNVHHRDSLGNMGLIGPGDVQWMTAGSGILHEEMPRRGPEGQIFGFQLWVNLPAKKKMAPPAYQEVRAGSIPIITAGHGTIRVIAGNIANTLGPVTEISADPVYVDISLEPGSSLTLPLRQDYAVLAYVFEGSAHFSGQEISQLHMVVFTDGDGITVRSGSDGVRFLLMAGLPCGEPIIPYGPFVMNTRAEIQQALDDLRQGTFIK